MLLSPLNFDRYRAEIEPIFLKPRGGHGPGMSPCVTCHVRNGTPLKLEPLQEDENGGVFWTEAQSRKNFEVVSQLVVPAQPERSRLLQVPLVVGARFHVGGKFLDSEADPEWQTMAGWVRDADTSEAAAGDAGSRKTIRNGRCWPRGFEARSRGARAIEPVASA